MMGRNRRGNRQAGMKARLGIASAVLIGGGAAGVAAIAAGNHGPAPTTTATSAGFIMHFHQRIGERAALGAALSTWGMSHQGWSLNTLAQMAPMRTFSQVWGGWQHRTMYAAQRGVVVLATRKFLLVKSADGGIHLWWLTGGTVFRNVSANPAGMTAMTGDDIAAVQAMVRRNLAPAATVMAGSTTAAQQMAAPVARPTTITILSGTQVITITITSTTATVTGPGTTPTATATVTPAPSVMAIQPAFTATRGVARGDLVFIAGVRERGRLIARLVLFSAPPAMRTPVVTPTVAPGITSTSAPTFSGTKS